MVVDHECTVPNIVPLSTIDVIPTYENTTSNLTKLTTRFNAIVSCNIEIEVYAIIQWHDARRKIILF